MGPGDEEVADDEELPDGVEDEPEGNDEDDEEAE